jgi:hypothetical protein
VPANKVESPLVCIYPMHYRASPVERVPCPGHFLAMGLRNGIIEEEHQVVNPSKEKPVTRCRPPPPRPNPLLKRQKAKSRNPRRGISNRLKQKCNLWSAGSYNTVDSWEQVTYLVIPSATNRTDCISKTFSKRELR